MSRPNYENQEIAFLRIVAIGLFLSLTSSFVGAFPPAPGFVAYGLVRNENGQVVDGPNAYIVFKSGDVTLARSSLKADISSGSNYRVLLPNDMNGGVDGYKDGVFDAALPFTVQVQIGSRTFDPIESSAGLTVPGDPGSALRLDFSLGTDSDMDGLPDEWEFQQLLNAGIDAGSANYNLDQLSGDGDFDDDGLTDRQEYLAGTFAYLNFNTMTFRVLSLDGEEGLRVQFLAVEGHSYSFEGSPDLEVWEPITVSVVGDDTIPEGATALIEATDTRILSIAIQTRDVALQGLKYFRLKIDREL